MKYKITRWYTESWSAEVEADSLEEAIETADDWYEDEQKDIEREEYFVEDADGDWVEAQFSKPKKEVIVRLTGHTEVFLIEHTVNGIELDAERFESYDYMRDLEDDGLVDEDMREIAFLKEIDELSYSTDGETWTPITKKGKYVKSENYLAAVCHVEPPYAVQHSDSVWADFEYHIELDEDEEFDPMKLQLDKCNYEAAWLPYGIITQYVWYDNRMITNKLEKCFDEFAESGCFLYDDFNTCRHQF